MPAAAPSVPDPDCYFERPGARLRYRDEGSGPAVLLVHGWTLDLDMWEPQAAALSDEFRVLRFDRRGFGLSSGVPLLSTDALDLVALLDHLRMPRAVIVGMSQGARIAVRVALAAPERVAALVLDGPPHLAAESASGADEDLPLQRYRELARHQGMEAFRREWRLHPFVRLHTDSLEVRALLRRVLGRYSGRDLTEPPATSDHTLDIDSIARVQQPALILNGERDTESRRRAGEALFAALRGAERALIPRAGHLANLDNPQGYNTIVRDFLRRQFRTTA